MHSCYGKGPCLVFAVVSGEMSVMSIELTILMPCLNEAKTLANCIRKSKRFLSESGIAGEVLVADNGSTDGSQQIARDEGARVVEVADAGYGAAVLGGIQAARGRYVIMADADDSYDLSALAPFVERLRDGADLVMGNRFKGGIAKGAMPFLHRYVGNPILSGIGRLFFGTTIGDFHCGLRGMNRKRIKSLNLRTIGMEFASEMVVRAALAKYRIDEVPTTLNRDGRERASHLRPWRDGWRHLRFLLMYSPKWLFLYPGIFLLGFGLFGTVLLLPSPVRVGNVNFDIHTFVVACISILIGLQGISFAVVSRRFAAARGFIPPSARYTNILNAMTLERLLLVALVIGALGVCGLFWCVAKWSSTGFGALQYASLLRVLVLSLTAVAASLQLALTAFLAGIMEIPVQMPHELQVDAPPRATTTVTKLPGA